MLTACIDDRRRELENEKQREEDLQCKLQKERDLKHQEMLDWLKPLNQEDVYRSYIKQRIPGTSEWIFTSESYKGWLDSDMDMLWVHGNAG